MTENKGIELNKVCNNSISLVNFNRDKRDK